MRIAIFTHVIHQELKGRYFAYSPYVREMNIWLKNFEEVEVIAPLPIAIETKREKHTHEIPYEHYHLSFKKIPSFDLLNLNSSVKAIFQIPTIILRIIGAMKRADHLHLRCPGNMGLLASICQIFYPGKPKTAKYAGNWDLEAKQPWTYKLQRWILANPFLTRNMTVLVYGSWPEQSKNILPFFTASFSENEIEKIQKDFNTPYKFLFVGNLVPGKQPQLAIRLVEGLQDENIPVELHIYGDGILKNELEIQAGNKAYIHLHGNQPLDVVRQSYKDSHFLILASKSEGWPKAVAEAMFFGCIPVVTNISCVPWMLAAPPPDSYRDRKGGAPKVTVTERGILIPTPDSYPDRKGGDRTEELIKESCNAVRQLLNDPEEMKKMSREAQKWSQEYTLEKFEKEIRKLIVPKDART